MEERQTYRQTDRQTDRETEKQEDREVETNRHTERERKRETRDRDLNSRTNAPASKKNIRKILYLGNFYKEAINETGGNGGP